MDSEASHQSHALRWTLGVLTALLLYVLSFGPVVGMIDRGAIPYPVASWLDAFYRPVGWLLSYTPLKDPLDLYTSWWVRILKKP